MKTSMNAEVVELNIAATAQGSKTLTQVDNYWTDKETGDLYASYASGKGENVESDDFQVIKYFFCDEERGMLMPRFFIPQNKNYVNFPQKTY